MFAELDLTKQDSITEVDFSLLDEMFCRPLAEVEAEEAKKQAQKQRQAVQTERARNVLEVKQITEIAFAIASLRMSSQDVYDALITLDDFALNEEQVSKINLIIPEPEQEKLLEDNRAAAAELTNEEQYLLSILRVPGIKGHL